MGDDRSMQTCPRAAVRSFVRRAGRMGTGQQRALAELGPRFVLPFGRAPLDFAAVVRPRRADRCSRSASAWATPPRASPRRCPSTNFIGVEVHEPGVGALLKRIGEQRLDATCASCAHDAVEVLRADDRARLAGRRARLLPRPVAQEAPPQAPADPAAVRAHAGRAASRPAATCTARPTGSPTPSRCWRCCRPSRCSQHAPKALRRRPPYRPLTKFEKRGLAARPRRVGPAVQRAADAHACQAHPAPLHAVAQHDDAEHDAVPGERREVVASTRSGSASGCTAAR